MFYYKQCISNMMFRKSPLSITEFIGEHPHCEQIITCLYGLNFLEFQLFCGLLQLEEADVDELMKHINKNERTRINRSLKTLYELGLCNREKHSEKKKKGYKFVYRSVPLTKIKKELLEKVNSWHRNIIKEIDNMNQTFETKFNKPAN